MRKSVFLLVAAALLATGCEKKGNDVIDEPGKENQEQKDGRKDEQQDGQEQMTGATSLHLDELCFDFQLSKDSVKTWMAENSSLTLTDEVENRLDSRIEFRNETYGMGVIYVWLAVSWDDSVSSIGISYKNPNMSEEKALSEFEEKWEFTSKLERLGDTEEMAKYGFDYFTYAGKAYIGGKIRPVEFMERKDERNVTTWSVIID